MGQDFCTVLRVSHQQKRQPYSNVTSAITTRGFLSPPQAHPHDALHGALYFQVHIFIKCHQAGGRQCHQNKQGIFVFWGYGVKRSVTNNQRYGRKQWFSNNPTVGALPLKIHFMPKSHVIRLITHSPQSCETKQVKTKFQVNLLPAQKSHLTASWPFVLSLKLADAESLNFLMPVLSWVRKNN